MAVFIILWILCAAIGYWIGQTKGRGGEGAALGLLLGFIGIIIIAVMKPTAELQARENLMVADAQARLYGMPTAGATPYSPAAPNKLYTTSGSGGAQSYALERSLADQIAQLAELRAQGALSEEEFSAAKARLLSGHA